MTSPRRHRTRASSAGTHSSPRLRCVRRQGAAILLFGALLFTQSFTLPAEALPEIRMHARNRVPQCVTPDRLMRFLRERNPELPAKLRDIARYYKEHGEKLKVRWDYAFFQMILETNYLIFRNNAGQGDVDPGQNNFAGIGTTGGGVPGDRFPNVSTGVLAQMQHLIAYSGERVANPVAQRTREMQDDIVKLSLALGRPPTFRDLTRRWATDRNYGRSIESVANRFRTGYCNDRSPDPEPQPDRRPDTIAAKDDDTASSSVPDWRGRSRVAAAEPVAEPPKARRGRRGTRIEYVSGNTRQSSDDTETQTETETVEAVTPEETEASPATETETVATTAEADTGQPQAITTSSVPDWRRSPRVEPTSAGTQASAKPASPEPPGGCQVFTASYGGTRNVLIRNRVGDGWHYTALQVLDGKERQLATSFIGTHAAGGEIVSEFASRKDALDHAFKLCPSAGRQASAED